MNPAMPDPAKIAAQGRAMQAGETVPEEGIDASQRRDFFGKHEDEIFYLDEGGSYVTLKYFNAGDRSKYMGKLNRKVALDRSGKAEMAVSGAQDQAILLSVAITGWDIQENGRALDFTSRNRERFLASAPVDVLDDIEAKVKKMNPWLDEELTVEEIDARIEDLEELKAEILEREGKESS